MININIDPAIRTHPLVDKLGLNYQTEFRYAIFTDARVPLESCARSYCENIKKLYEHIATLNEHIIKLEANLEALYSGTTGDIEFDASGNSLQVHSELVALHSEPLAKMVQSTMREGITKKIEIAHEEPEIVKEMLKFLYTQKTDLSATNSLPLLRLSCLYDINSLSGECLNFLSTNMDTTNCIRAYSLADLHVEQDHRWHGLFIACETFIRENSTHVLEANELTELDFTMLEKVFKVIVSSVPLKNQALLRWAKHNWNANDFPECIIYLLKEFSERQKAQLKEDKTTACIRSWYKFCSDALALEILEQSTRPSFLKLSSDYLTQFLALDDLFVTDEYLVLGVVNRWLQADPENRKEQLPGILESVRFPFISVSKLCTISEEFPLIAASENFPNLVQDAIKFQLSAATKMQNTETAKNTKKRTHYKETPFDTNEFASVVSTLVSPNKRQKI